MILREFNPAIGDAARLAAFACSTGEPFDNEVEEWIRTAAVAWINDVPRTTFQRRVLAFVEAGGELVAVVAWQDIVRVDLEGIWLEVPAIGLADQHRGAGRQALELTIDHLRTIDRDGDHVVGLVHIDNIRRKRLLSAAGWSDVAVIDGHELWVGAL
ncbi:MAG: hypothetical protein WKF43_09000 [Acidimicrobiales bacterium]